MAETIDPLNPTRGWEISDGVKIIKSLDLETIGIVCVGEDNIDDISFSNDYDYNDETETYSLNAAHPNQQSFTIKFLVTQWGEECAKTIVSLKSFFNQVGHEFILTRNVSKVPNTFVVDTITTGHYEEEGNFVAFEVSGSYVGNTRDYTIVRRKVVFNGEDPIFEFDHFFAVPEPSTEFGISEQGDFIKTVVNNTGKSEGLVYTIRPFETITTIKITNLTYDELFKVDFKFEKNDRIIFDTELDEPIFTLSRDGIVTNLLTYVDFTAAPSLPLLYPGANRIRIDLINDGVGIANSDLYAEYWDRVV